MEITDSTLIIERHPSSGALMVYHAGDQCAKPHAWFEPEERTQAEQWIAEHAFMAIDCPEHVRR